MRKLLLLSEQAETSEQILTEIPEGFTLCVLPPSASAEERKKEIADAEVIFGEPSAEELQCAKKLRWLQIFWAGYDRYLSEDFPKNVCLTNVSGAFGETIAEHMLAMLFALCRRLPAYGKDPKWLDRGTEKAVCGANALIFGCGDIGTETAKRLKALGVHTVGVCRNARSPRPYFDALTTLSCAEAFLPEADFVLCAIPSDSETNGYLNAERLELLKNDAVLINVGRGKLIDTDALTNCLKAGKLFGVGLDVTEPEPLPLQHPLYGIPNVIITPHIAGVGFGHLPQTEHKIAEICRENLQRYASGEPLRNVRIAP